MHYYNDRDTAKEISIIFMKSDRSLVVNTYSTNNSNNKLITYILSVGG